MRTLLILIVLMLLASAVEAQVYVRPHARRDGTYVPGHYRSKPDGNPHNNYSYPGNVNPYTGRVAPGEPNKYLRDYDGGSRPRRSGSALDRYLGE